MSPQWANMMYVMFITVTVIVSLSLKYSGEDLNIGYKIGMPTSTPSVCVPSPGVPAVTVAGVVIQAAVPAVTCENLAYDMCNTTSCQGMWAVYRLSFSIAGFFLVMLLLTCTKTSFSTTMHRGFWFGKGLGLVLLVIACLFAPNDLFAGFAWFARIGAPLFVIYQVVCFIDFGYTFSAQVVEKDEREDNFFGLTNHGAKYKGFMLFVRAPPISSFRSAPPLCPLLGRAIVGAPSPRRRRRPRRTCAVCRALPAGVRSPRGRRARGDRGALQRLPERMRVQQRGRHHVAPLLADQLRHHALAHR